jgi:membrane protease YdiL (CAAX protease family)
MWVALVLSAALVAYNNLINRWGPFHSWAYIPLNVAFATSIALLAIPVLDLSREELGVSGDLSDVVLPLLAVVLFGLGALAIALSRHAPRIADARVADRRGLRLAFYVLVRIPLGTAVVEEFVFRGVLFAAWRTEGLSEITAALCAAVAFGVWHVTPTVIAVRMNDPGASKDKVRAAVAGAVLLTTVAGLGLTWLRMWTDGLLAPIVLHAGVNSVGALAAAFASRRTTTD